jgi:hypothetical protein
MVELILTADEGIVLFEFLSPFSQDDVLSIEHKGERQALWNLLCVLEKKLGAQFQADFSEQLAAARERLASTFKG